MQTAFLFIATCNNVHQTLVVSYHMTKKRPLTYPAQKAGSPFFEHLNTQFSAYSFDWVAYNSAMQIHAWQHGKDILPSLNEY